MTAMKFKGKDRKLKTLVQLRKVSPEAFESECKQKTDGGNPASFVLCEGFLFCLTEDYGGGFSGVWDGAGFDEVYPGGLGFEDTEDGEDAYDDLMDKVHGLAS